MIWLTQIAVAVVSGAIVWYITWRTGVLRQERERLHNERRQIYIRVLRPYFHILGGKTSPDDLRESLRRLKSVEHRTALFELTLVGSDGVVRAVSDFMQQGFRVAQEGSTMSPSDLVQTWGGVLLAIRRDLRDRKTQLRERDMLRSFITDIDDTLNI